MSNNIRKDRKDYPVGVPYGRADTILLEELTTTSTKNRIGRFLCDCGNSFTARISEIIKGVTIGCGCRKAKGPNRSHGYRDHPMYNTYTLMIARCYCKTNKLYKYYGARGITVSDEFRGNPKAFIDYISSLPYYDRRLDTENYDFSLDRIDNDGIYRRGNLRWATRDEQRGNRRDF